MIGTLLFFFVANALAGKWDDVPADVVATRTLPAAPSAVYAPLSTPASLMALFPADCATWGTPLAGEVPGATGLVTYHAASMHRKLDAVWKTATPDARVELDHLGNRGFVTRWQLTPAEAGTTVVMTTYLNPPPKPFRGLYYTRVKPAWEGCHARTLEALEAAAKG